MIFAHRIVSENDQGEVTTDYEGVDVPRAAKRALPFDDSTPEGRRRYVKVLAVKILIDHGMKPADIALAIEYSERQVWRWAATMREMAEAGGRV